MYSLSGKLIAKAGFERELFQLLKEAGVEMEKLSDCQKYQVTQNQDKPEEILIEEVWIDEAAHKNSLKLAITRDMINKGRPMIASME